MKRDGFWQLYYYPSLAVSSTGAQVVTGSFSLAGVAYTNTLTVSTLASRLSAQLEDALTGFGLAGLQEATITAVSNRWVIGKRRQHAGYCRTKKVIQALSAI